MEEYRVSVTITGDTVANRKTLAARVNATQNGIYVLKPRIPVDYVVSNDLSDKVSRMIADGSEWIVEARLEQFLAAGKFPGVGTERKTGRPQGSPQSGDQIIVWKEWYKPPRTCNLQYTDRDGHLIMLSAEVERRGTSASGTEYLGVSDAGRFKTLRTDRILRADYL